jgi:hypothetical protein
MKPINFDASTCNPISSNCVIWQGPDIPIINLCSGDSISDVVYALALQLEEVMKQINVNSYDLSCFNITSCKPDDFTALLQFLIGKICELENINPPSEKSGGCPDCMVTVAQCLQTNGQQTMNLVEYVNLIAEKLCALISQVAALDTRVTNLETAVNALQNTPAPTLTVPPVNVTCASTSFTSNQVWIVVQEFINNYWCPFYQTTGTASELFSSLNPDCPYPVLVPAITPATTLAEAITNIWRVICGTPPVTVASEDTPTIITTVTGGPDYIISSKITDTGWINLNGFGYLSGNDGKPQCRRIGNEVHFRGYIIVPIGSSTNGNGGTVVASPDPESYNDLPKGQTFNTEDASVLTDACKLKTYGGVDWNTGEKAISLQFNQGNSVIPTGILGPGETFDGSYLKGTREIIYRIVKSSDRHVCLHTLVSLSVDDTGVLTLGSVLADESYQSSTYGYEFGAIGRNLISNIVSGDYVPTYTPTSPSQYNAPSAGAYATSQITGAAGTWLFNQDAGRADQLGGFLFRLDGLRSFIEPCGVYVPTYASCV